MKILFKYPSCSRLFNFFRGIKSIQDNLNNKEDYMIYATLDDKDVMDSDDIRGWMLDIDNLEYNFGESKSKIDACNRDMDKTNTEYDWDIVVLMSDDMVFIQKGFDDIIRNDLKDLDSMVHYPDGNQNEKLCTMTIMGREYYNRFGYLYHPDYTSLWCDVEFTEVAWMLGKYKYNPTQLFRHLHPAWGLAPSDPQYKKTESVELWNKDYEVILSRRALNYGLTEIVNKYKYERI